MHPLGLYQPPPLTTWSINRWYKFFWRDASHEDTSESCVLAVQSLMRSLIPLSKPGVVSIFHLTLSSNATRVFPKMSNYCFKVIERSPFNSTSHLKQPLYHRLICKDLCHVWCKNKRWKANKSLEWKAFTSNLRPQYISSFVGCLTPFTN